MSSFLNFTGTWNWKRYTNTNVSITCAANKLENAEGLHSRSDGSHRRRLLRRFLLVIIYPFSPPILLPLSTDSFPPLILISHQSSFSSLIGYISIVIRFWLIPGMGTCSAKSQRARSLVIWLKPFAVPVLVLLQNSPESSIDHNPVSLMFYFSVGNCLMCACLPENRNCSNLCGIGFLN